MGGLGVSGHLTVTLELQPLEDCRPGVLQLFSQHIACPRGLYGSPVPAGAKVVLPHILRPSLSGSSVSGSQGPPPPTSGSSDGPPHCPQSFQVPRSLPALLLGAFPG